MDFDPTKIDIVFDPLTQRMRGRTAHRGLDFDVPFISPIEGNLYMGGCRDGLALPHFFRHLISLYPWESYRVDHDLETTLSVKAYDADIEALEPKLPALVEWASACVASGPTLIHCQAGLNRSGLIAALVLMARGNSSTQAIALLRTKRSAAVLCNPSFEKWLETRD